MNKSTYNYTNDTALPANSPRIGLTCTGVINQLLYLTQASYNYVLD